MRGDDLKHERDYPHCVTHDLADEVADEDSHERHPPAILAQTESRARFAAVDAVAFQMILPRFKIDAHSTAPIQMDGAHVS